MSDSASVGIKTAGGNVIFGSTPKANDNQIGAGAEALRRAGIARNDCSDADYRNAAREVINAAYSTSFSEE